MDAVRPPVRLRDPQDQGPADARLFKLATAPRRGLCKDRRRDALHVRAVDHEGEVLEALVTKRCDRKAALKFLEKLMKRYGRPEQIVTDKLRSYGAAMKEIGNADRQQTQPWL